MSIFLDRQSSYDGGTYQSQSVLFQDFLLRANKYPSLSLGMENIHSGKIILVEVCFLSIIMTLVIIIIFSHGNYPIL